MRNFFSRLPPKMTPFTHTSIDSPAETPEVLLVPGIESIWIVKWCYFRLREPGGGAQSENYYSRAVPPSAQV